MKLLLMILLPLLSKNAQEGKKDTKQTFYYFCESRARKAGQTNGKQYVLFTSVKEIKCDESDLKKRAQGWGNLVNAACKNDGGCSSDLNSFGTYKEAKMEFRKMLHEYNDAHKYQLKKISF